MVHFCLSLILCLHLVVFSNCNSTPGEAAKSTAHEASTEPKAPQPTPGQSSIVPAPKDSTQAPSQGGTSPPESGHLQKLLNMVLKMLPLRPSTNAESRSFEKSYEDMVDHLKSALEKAVELVQKGAQKSDDYIGDAKNKAKSQLRDTLRDQITLLKQYKDRIDEWIDTKSSQYLDYPKQMVLTPLRTVLMQTIKQLEESDKKIQEYLGSTKS